MIAEKFTTKRILFLNRDVSDAEKINIVSNVDEQWSKYDVVIYTPSVCMGVSYDKLNHFDAIYAYAHTFRGCRFVHVLYIAIP
jgi:hypothetical protein